MSNFDKFWEEYNCEPHTGRPMFSEDDRILAEHVYEIAQDRKEVTLSESMNKLCQELKSDPDYLRSWVANIAMPFMDQHAEVQHQFYDSHMMNSLHEVSNAAAIQFIRNLIGDQKLEIE